MKTVINILFVSATLLCSCTKNKERVLPPATQEGLGTFGCRINGIVWLPQSTLIFSNNHIQFGHGWINFDFGRIDSPYAGGIQLICFPIKKDTSFVISNQSGENAVQDFGFWEMVGTHGLNFQPVHGHQGVLTITRYDTINHICSGTFSFTGVDTLTGQVINVTDGRFDLK
jgi:hypothetical protein